MLVFLKEWSTSTLKKLVNLAEQHDNAHSKKSLKAPVGEQGARKDDRKFSGTPKVQ